MKVEQFIPVITDIFQEPILPLMDCSSAHILFSPGVKYFFNNIPRK